ncbi:MAG: globin family protein [Candidatus Scalindua sp.]|nr:globin family protein [Candidatus Scalindua sp.]MDV5165606.1 globin family protein [Candidatus Scalindua sp.]
MQELLHIEERRILVNTIWRNAMKVDQIKLVQDTFDKVRPISEEAAKLFYNRLFELDPSLKSLFNGDMKTQGKMLMQMLDYAVTGLDRLDTIILTIQDLGKRHVGYGVKDEYYETVGEALLWTLEQGLGKDFTPDVKDAWAETYKLLSDIMKSAT